MRVCAVICEYNPFHLGHAYHLRAAREASGADYVLCLMSGALTQRGAFARHDKWLRARAALENGADLVLELPTRFACAPAPDFASGGVAGALSEEGEATGNVFVSDALHGIDGISYTGGAERVPFASLKALEGVPSEFLDLKLVFSADGQVIKTIHFEYGDSIDVSEIPAVPEKEGYTGAWPELDLSLIHISEPTRP